MNFLYTLLIYPLELIYKTLYLSINSFVHSYGIALILLSCCSFIFLLPLSKLASKQQKKEADLQSILQPQLDKIKSTSKGAEQHQRINALYKRYSYNPIYAIRSSFGLFVQIPFLMAAYIMLSSLESLKGVPFFFIKDLSAPDGLLGGISFLPILMTGINIVNAFFISSLGKQERRQALAISFLFLVLLYNAPSALLIYWTTNNILHLCKAIVAPKHISLPIKTIHIFSKIPKGLFTSPLHSTGLLFALAFFTPFFFVLTQNLHMFLPKSIIYTLGIMIVPCAVLLIAGIVLDVIKNILKKYASRSQEQFTFANRKNISFNVPTVSFILYNIILLASLYCTVYLMLRVSINLQDYVANKFFVRLLFIVLTFFFFVLVKRYSLKAINLFLVCFFCIVFVQVPFSIQDLNTSDIVHTPTTKENTNTLSILLENKPNIYLFYLESFHDLKIMKENYDIPVEEMEKALHAKGFTFYEDFFSNSPATLPSLLDLYSMDLKAKDLYKGQDDIASSARYLLGGSHENFLLRYLQSQGYHTSAFYTSDPNYYVFYKGKALNTLYCEDRLKPKEYILYILKTISKKLKKIIKKYMLDLVSYENTLPSLLLQKAVQTEIDLICKREKPTFFFYKGGANHAPNYDFKKDFPAFRVQYKELVRKSYENEILPTIAMIEEKDPNALIILLGDHGAMKYRCLVDEYFQDISQVEDVLHKNNVTMTEFTNSLYRVFLAVKMPKDSRQDISFDLPMSSANLFRHIFASIDNNKDFLKTRVRNISYWHTAGLLEDGKVLKSK